MIKNVEVAAVDWLSTNVIMAGTRGSQVMLYDIRSGGSTVRAQHPHGVHSLKKVDEWRIAVAGWGNNVPPHSSLCPLLSTLSNIFIARNLRPPLHPQKHQSQLLPLKTNLQTNKQP